MRSKTVTKLGAGGAAATLLALLAASPAAAAHPAVRLADGAGSSIGLASTAPYSPRQTCGACHDYDGITKGYHFQQGYDVMADLYNEAKPWLLSPGMVGKW